MKNYRIRVENGEAVAVLGGYTTSAGAAVLVNRKPQRIGQVAHKLGRLDSGGTVFVRVDLLAVRWSEAAATWQWYDLGGLPVESPL